MSFHISYFARSEYVPIAFFESQMPLTVGVAGCGEGRGVTFNASSSPDIKLSSTAAVYASGEDYLEQGRKLGERRIEYEPRVFVEMYTW